MSIKKQGLFISFEGIDGSGKSTVIEALCRTLDEAQIPFVRTREPGGTPIAEQLREILLNKDAIIDNDTELLMMFAGRSHHISTVIKPSLLQNKWVICDRFIDSTFAYQGFGRNMPLSQIELLVAKFVPIMPNITFYLKIDARTAMGRTKNRGAGDRIDLQSQEFFERVAKGFDHQACNDKDGRIVVIDANQSPDQIASKVVQYLSTHNYLS